MSVWALPDADAADEPAAEVPAAAELALGGPGTGCESFGAPGVGGHDRSASAVGPDGAETSGRGAEPTLNTGVLARVTSREEVDCVDILVSRIFDQSVDVNHGPQVSFAGGSLEPVLLQKWSAITMIGLGPPTVLRLCRSQTHKVEGATGMESQSMRSARWILRLVRT
jgi:hypothetical protein